MIILDEWQKDVLNCKSRKILLCTGRRVGKTYIMARKAVERMIKQKTRVLVFSLTEEQAQIILAFAKQILGELAPKLMSKKHTETNSKTMTLKNGSWIKCRPTGDTGDSSRGFDADIVIVDEAARQGKLFWIAARPIILMSAGELWLCSTPFGKQGYFWEMFNDSYNLHSEKAQFTVFYTTTEKVVNERKASGAWTEEKRQEVLNDLEQEKKTMTRLEYGQEYLGLFLEDLMQFFPDEMIQKCQTMKRPGRIDENITYYMGQDIARMGEDETTTEIGYFLGDVLIHVENEVSKHTYLSDTYKRNLELDSMYNFRKMLIDDEGIGVGVFDMMMDNEQTKSKTIGINNSKRVIDRDGKEKGILKTELYYNLRAMMEQELIRLLDDESVFQSLKSVQYEYSTDVKGNPVIKIHGNYTHIAEGLIRLAHAVKYKELNIMIGWM